MERIGDIYSSSSCMENMKKNSKNKNKVSARPSKWLNFLIVSFSQEFNAKAPREQQLIVNFVHRAFYVAKCYLISKNVEQN